MKKKSVLILKLLFIFSIPVYSQATDKPCIENKIFKQEYFKYIENVEVYALQKRNSDSVFITHEILVKSLKAIGLFSDVDWSLLGNYSYNYSNISQFLEQKKKWVDWYNMNKCKNLKWP